MKASELRIGNYVTDEFYDSFQTIFTVESINNKGINLLIEDDGNWSEIAQRWIAPEYEIENLHGIPLTEEWLVKFGFKSTINKDSGCGHSILGEFNIWVDNGSLIYWKVKGSVELKHVHQLQNLYWCLFGEELTIKDKT